ncbi:MarR family winged helix-turn-helix transcriptional regulator [Leucobacter luti]|uniref:MarR family winged helix-turn-helix transcriptional regulator n=1 Tax=Leucobacter luti TaxID=340320 RepID=UPI003D030534
MREHGSEPDASKDAMITEIISEFSDVFTFAKSRWARYAGSLHPELNGVGLMILQLILKKGPLTVTGIGHMLDMDKAMVSRQITKLRELDFVDAVPSPEDRRVTLLTGSERAKREFKRIREEWARSYHERFTEWSLVDLETLRSGLHRFNDAAEESPQEGPAARCTRDHAASDA